MCSCAIDLLSGQEQEVEEMLKLVKECMCRKAKFCVRVLLLCSSLLVQNRSPHLHRVSHPEEFHGRVDTNLPLPPIVLMEGYTV